MISDIRILISFRGHRKRRRLKRILGPGYLDYLIDLWIGAAQLRPDGKLKGWSEEDIADEAGWQGDPKKLIQALKESGWLDYSKRHKFFFLHDWPEHQPYIMGAKIRKEKARKAAYAKWGKHSKANQISGNKKKINDAPSIAQSIPTCIAPGNAPSNAKTKFSNARSIAPTYLPRKYLKNPGEAGNGSASGLILKYEQEIKDLCADIGKLPNKNGRRFIPEQCARFHLKDNKHPQAIIDAFTWARDNWQTVEDAWGVIKSIVDKRSGNHYEADHIEKTNQLRVKR